MVITTGENPGQKNATVPSDCGAGDRGGFNTTHVRLSHRDRPTRPISLSRLYGTLLFFLFSKDLVNNFISSIR
jgi:hypothetical protein